MNRLWRARGAAVFAGAANLQRFLLRRAIVRLQTRLADNPGAEPGRALQSQLAAARARLAMLDESPPPAAPERPQTSAGTAMVAVGDRVALAGGDPMLVVDMDESQLTVAWRRGGRIFEDVLDRAAVRRVA